MRLLRTIEELTPARASGVCPPVVLAIGNFDGIHRGHRAVIRQTQTIAAELATEPSSEHAPPPEAWLLTFDPHPCHIVAPERCQPLLATRSQKEALLAATGLDATVFMPFERATADLEPRAFLQLLTKHIPGLAAVVVGENWRFGRRAAGNVDTLKTLAAELGFEVHLTELTEWQGERVSSTRIRKAIAAGKMRDAAAMLERPHRVEGLVVKGRQQGRQQGFPTANISCETALLPPPGIYAVASPLEENGEQVVWGGAAYLNQNLVEAGIIEVHYFDRDENLYGRHFTVDILQQLRPDRTFEDMDELVAQITRDVDEARAVFARR